MLIKCLSKVFVYLNFIVMQHHLWLTKPFHCVLFFYIISVLVLNYFMANDQTNDNVQKLVERINSVLQNVT